MASFHRRNTIQFSKSNFSIKISRFDADKILITATVVGREVSTTAATTTTALSATTAQTINITKEVRRSLKLKDGRKI